MKATAEGAQLVGTGRSSVPSPAEAPYGTTVLEQVFLTSRERLVGFARTVLADTDGAEEIVQEAFARTLAHWDRIDNKADPLPYIRSTILNLCRARFRHRPTPLHSPRSEPSAEAVSERTARRVAVVDAVATLPDRQREVVAMRYFAQLSTEETAQALGISPGTVKTHLHRATQTLASRLEEHRHG